MKLAQTLYPDRLASVERQPPAIHPAGLMTWTGQPGGILVIGERPGRGEREPFDNRSGQQLRAQLERLAPGVPVAFDYAFRDGHQLTGKKSDQPALEQSRSWLHQTLLDVQPARVLALGSDAHKALTGQLVQASIVRKAHSFLSTGCPVWYLPRPWGPTTTNRVLQRWYSRDLQHAVTEPTPPSPFGGTWREVLTVEDAQLAWEELSAAECWVFDTETFGPMHTPDFRIVCLAACAPGTRHAWVWGQDACQLADPRAQVILRLLRERPCAGHNLKYDSLACAYHFGQRPMRERWCTRLLAKLRRADGPAGLDPQAALVGMGGHKLEAKRHLALVSEVLSKLRTDANRQIPTDWAEVTSTTAAGHQRTRRVVTGSRDPTPIEVTRATHDAWVKPRTRQNVKTTVAELTGLPAPTDDWLLAVSRPDTDARAWVYGLMDRTVCHRYCARDTVTTGLLLPWLRSQIALDSGLQLVWDEILGDATHGVCSIELAGLLVDQQALATLEAKLDQMLLDSWAVISRHAPKDFNPASPDQLADWLFQPVKSGGLGLPPGGLTKTGKPCTDAQTLASLVGRHPAVAALLDYKKAAKLQSNYARGMRRFVSADGRVHCTLNIDGAASGRLSCLPGSTEVLTSHGPLRLDSAELASLVRSGQARVLTHRGRWAQVTRLMRLEPSATCGILLADGTSQTCTPDHQVWTTAGWSRADQLEPGRSHLLVRSGVGPGLLGGAAEPPASTGHVWDTQTGIQPCPPCVQAQPCQGGTEGAWAEARASVGTAAGGGLAPEGPQKPDGAGVGSAEAGGRFGTGRCACLARGYAGSVVLRWESVLPGAQCQAESSPERSQIEGNTQGSGGVVYCTHTASGDTTGPRGPEGQAGPGSATVGDRQTAGNLRFHGPAEYCAPWAGGPAGGRPAATRGDCGESGPTGARSGTCSGTAGPCEGCHGRSSRDPRTVPGTPTDPGDLQPGQSCWQQHTSTPPTRGWPCDLVIQHGGSRIGKGAGGGGNPVRACCACVHLTRVDCGLPGGGLAGCRGGWGVPHTARHESARREQGGKDLRSGVVLASHPALGGGPGPSHSAGHGGVRAVQVESVTHGPTQVVWDLTVDTDHSFATVNGVQHHNCSAPNLQTIVSRGSLAKLVKRVFCAPAGKKLVVIDYSTLELRIIAMLAGEQSMIDVFRAGTDLHRQTAIDVGELVWGTDFHSCGLGYTFTQLLEEHGLDRLADLLRIRGEDPGAIGDPAVGWTPDMGTVDHGILVMPDGTQVHEPRWQALLDAQKARRTVAKGVNFSVVYGQGPETLAANWGISVDVASAAQEAIMGRRKDIQRWIRDTIRNGRRVGYTRTWWAGQPARIRPLPDLGSSSQDRRSHAERAGYNSAVQGTGSDFCLASLVRLVRELERLKAAGELDAQVVLTVHDSILFECADADLPRLVQLARSIMTGHDSQGVPITVDVEVGQSWGDLEPYRD